MNYLPFTKTLKYEIGESWRKEMNSSVVVQFPSMSKAIGPFSSTAKKKKN
jgi:hypothetical protein